MKANEMQVGGDHYKSAYQHWDWATDVDLPPLLKDATKYWARWPKKGGLQDLEKSQHYLQKFLEIEKKKQERALGLTKRFIEENKIGSIESDAIWGVLQYSLGDAQHLVNAAHALLDLVTKERARVEAEKQGITLP